MNAKPSSSKNNNFRKFEIGATVYHIDEHLNAIAGRVTDVQFAANGYPRTWVTFPVPYYAAGTAEWAVERLYTLPEAKAQIAEMKETRSIFARR